MIGPTYTTTVNLGTQNSEVVVSSISSSVQRLTATSFLSGPAGATGATGAAGQGVPTGGTIGQYLKKNSGTDYDTSWSTVAGGSSTVSVVTKSANYTITSSDDVVLGNTTSGSITITLPTAVGVTKTYTIKKIISANTLNIATTSAQTIDGSTTIALVVQYESITVASDGTNWNVI